MVSDSPSTCRPRVAASGTVTASSPRSALPAPNTSVAPQAAPAVSAPEGGAGDRQGGQHGPARRRPRQGRTVAKAKAPVSARITTIRLGGSTPRPDRTSPSRPVQPPRHAPPAAPPLPRCPHRGAGRGRSGLQAQLRQGQPVRWFGERCPACHQARAPGAIRSASSAAAVTTNPSSSNVCARTAAWAQKPAIAARSAPPQATSSASGSERTGLDR